MGAAAVPLAIGGGTALANLLGLNKQQTQFVSPPGIDAFRNYYLNSIMGKPGGAGAGSPLSVLQSFAGGGTSDLQRGSTGISQYSNQMAPELQTLLGIAQNPGTASGLDALKPVFNQNLNDASNRLNATAPGGRFSSGMLQAQGALNQKSLNDFNLMAQQMLQQGVQNQISAANSAGSMQQNALQMLLGPALGNAFPGSVITQPGALSQGLQAGGSALQMQMLIKLLGQQNQQTYNPQTSGFDPAWWAQLGGNIGNQTIQP